MNNIYRKCKNDKCVRKRECTCIDNYDYIYIDMLEENYNYYYKCMSKTDALYKMITNSKNEINPLLLDDLRGLGRDYKHEEMEMKKIMQGYMKTYMTIDEYGAN